MEAVPVLALVGEADAPAFAAVLDFSPESMRVMLTVICFASATAHEMFGIAQLVLTVTSRSIPSTGNVAFLDADQPKLLNC